MIYYRLIRGFCYIVGNRLQETAHRFLVIRWNTAVPLHYHLFILAQLTNWSCSSDPCDNVKDVETYGMQGFQVASIRASLIPFIAPLSVTSYATDLRHFLLFQAQSTSFLAQAFARTQLREFIR